MAKDLVFQMPVVYEMFRLTIHVASTSTATNFCLLVYLKLFLHVKRRAEISADIVACLCNISACLERI